MESTITLTLPQYVLDIASVLTQHGFKAYLVGGALRDTLLNQKTQDYDLATNALVSDLLQLFPNAKEVGAAFGTVVIPVWNDKKKKHVTVEVTTFRSEGEYKDFRHPSKVEFINDIYEDLKRRDFTINAMAADLNPTAYQVLRRFPKTQKVTINTTLIDPFNGLKDLKNKLIKAVGNPLERFKEDPVRTLRACRFKAQLEFTIHPKTLQAIPQVLDLMQFISKERIQSELVKLLTQADKPSIGIECMRKTGLLRFVIPELLDCVGVKQPIGHAHDVYWHLLYTTDKAPKKLEVRLAALLHDIAKPHTAMPNGHFYGHDTLSAKMAEKILKRLKFSNQIIKKVVTLIKWHMFYYPNYIKEFKVKNPPSKWSDAAVRRFIQRVGAENLQDLFTLRIADATSNPKATNPYPEINALKKHIEKVMQEDLALKVTDLAINGNDLIKELNLKPGPVIGDTLRYLLDKVIENPKLNNRQDLLKLAKEFLKSYKPQPNA